MSESFVEHNKKENSVKTEDFKKFVGERIDDSVNKRLLEIWLKKGTKEAIQFCINDADKFTDDDIKLYLEEKLFGAGSEGLETKTPWNSYKRMKAGLSPLHSY